MQEPVSILPFFKRSWNSRFLCEIALFFKYWQILQIFLNPEEEEKQFVLFLTGFGHLANSLLPLIPVLIVSGCLETNAIFYNVVYFWTFSYLHIPKRMKGVSLDKMQISGSYSQTIGSMSAICQAPYNMFWHIKGKRYQGLFLECLVAFGERENPRIHGNT